mmetsp:Transcript_4615/g.13253  ORF Transcript_4615/g.13253 Transcript_4615/m.13253 type:complete len:1008 (+) Transcript_4615:196-3219(+)|eukprot:CAMPEP_0206141260 /NCGR_PEP_ID=MMETSP1473-20131121/12286_1 /ASSEMBLY_ACC=CAM_ASM_001109 /TAXON_ID=1461547 /ORGANISM="Stichococcus sp, Strain RCC1054" /LENGTH=1007 /DNA_ID=CAMNT_0053535755 /DNA_START=160 /DNA_END=3183 /DNA_ORIENTATION=-
MATQKEGPAAGKLIYSDRSPPLACVATAALKHLRLDRQPSSSVGRDQPPVIQVASGDELAGTDLVLRYLARLKQDDLFLYGKDALSSCQVDQWLAFAPALGAGPGLVAAAAQANEYLAARTFLVGHRLTLADIAVWGELAANQQWARLKAADMPHLQRWLAHVGAHPVLKATAEALGPKTKEQHMQAIADAGYGGGDTGTFLQLKNGVQGRVVTRFPPEPSGYLHIGHAKAALLNQFYARKYGGRLLIRFDDTNPSKEKDEYVENIMADIKTLGLKPDAPITYTSDYFPQMQDVTERLIKAGVLYADDTPQPEMAEQRSAPKVEDRISRCAGRTPEESLRIFGEMLRGTPEGQRNCLRFKLILEPDDAPLDEKNRGHMAMGNGALRDPVAFRCNAETHWRTGDKYKAYPTYDLACPFVDALEGVTHALRSSEYSDREPQFYWILKRLQRVWPDLPHVEIEDFSRLNLQNTVLSKRKLTELVDGGKVDGWGDPRMPTVQGLFRRGMQLQALSSFMESQGASKNTNLMEWGKLWAANKAIIDPRAPRHTRVMTGGPGVLPPVMLTVEDGPEKPEAATVPLHKKDPSIGNKTTIKLRRVLIDAVDAAEVAAAVADADAGTTAGADGKPKPLSEKKAAERRHVTLMDWGEWPAVLITAIEKDASGAVTGITAKQVPGWKANDTFLKLTWLADVEEARTALQVVRLGPLIKDAKAPKKVKSRPGAPVPAEPAPEAPVAEMFNPDSRIEYTAWGDANLKKLKRGAFLQLERDGYFTVDQAYDEAHPEQPIVLLDIPDGKDKRPVPSPGAQALLALAAAGVAPAAAAVPSSAASTPAGAATRVPPGASNGSDSSAAASNGASNDASADVKLSSGDVSAGTPASSSISPAAAAAAGPVSAEVRSGAVGTATGTSAGGVADDSGGASADAPAASADAAAPASDALEAPATPAAGGKTGESASGTGAPQTDGAAGKLGGSGGGANLSPAAAALASHQLAESLRGLDIMDSPEKKGPE